MSEPREGLGDNSVGLIACWGGERVELDRHLVRRASDAWAMALKRDGHGVTAEVLAATFLAGWHAARSEASHD